MGPWGRGAPTVLQPTTRARPRRRDTAKILIFLFFVFLFFSCLVFFVFLFLFFCFLVFVLLCFLFYEYFTHAWLKKFLKILRVRFYFYVLSFVFLFFVFCFVFLYCEKSVNLAGSRGPGRSLLLGRDKGGAHRDFPPRPPCVHFCFLCFFVSCVFCFFFLFFVFLLFVLLCFLFYECFTHAW